MDEKTLHTRNAKILERLAGYTFRPGPGASHPPGGDLAEARRRQIETNEAVSCSPPAPT
jgi:hypothetical protein